MSRPYLVRYVHDQSKLFVDFSMNPLLNLEDLATAYVRRMAHTYQFYTWESSRGDLWTAELLLTPEFFTLEKPPKSLLDDISWLSLETGLDIDTIDIFWVVKTSYILFGDPEIQDVREDED